MGDLQALLERVEKAVGPDREIDCAVAVAVDGYFVQGADPWGRPKYCYRDAEGIVSPGQGHDMLVRRYSASVDDDLALAERVLPGWECGVWAQTAEWRKRPKTWIGVLHDPRGWAGETRSELATPALALLAAIIRAKQAEDGKPS